MADERDDLNLGHNSAGSDCTSKVFEFGSKGAIAGKIWHQIHRPCDYLAHFRWFVWVCRVLFPTTCRDVQANVHEIHNSCTGQVHIRR